MVNVSIGPEQLFFTPVTLMLAMIGTPVVFTPAVNAVIFPELPADKLIAVLSFVQLKVTPPAVTLEPKTIVEMDPPEQTTMSEMASTIGVGLMVILNVLMLPPELVQPSLAAVTVMVPTISAPVLFTAAVPLISPTSEAIKPIEVFEFDQLITAPPTLLVNGIAIASPGQKVLFVTAVTTGCGLTVIVKISAGPAQPLVVEITLTVPTRSDPVLLAGAKYEEIFPLPDNGRPIKALLFVQAYVSPPLVLAVKAGTLTASPGQTDISATTPTTGRGFSVMVNVFALAPALVHPLAWEITVTVDTNGRPV